MTDKFLKLAGACGVAIATFLLTIVTPYSGFAVGIAAALVLLVSAVRRRGGWLRAIASGAAVAVGCYFAAWGISSVVDPGSPPSDSASSAPRDEDLTRHAPSQEDLLGAWRPISLFGEKETRTAIGAAPLDLRFNNQPEGFGWKAYDGCNWTSAFAKVDATGGFTTIGDALTTLRGCPRPAEARQNVEAIQKAKRLEFRGPNLVLLDADAKVIAKYVRI